MNITLKCLFGLLFLFCIGKFLPYSNEAVGKSSRTIITNLSRTNENFTGREEILKTVKSLIDSGHYPVVISGFLGTGKTQTARRFAELNQGNYDIVWVLDAKKSIIDQLRTLAAQLNNSRLSDDGGSPINVNSQPDVLLQRIHSFLQSTQVKWLLIFDNVQNKGDIIDYLPPKNNNSGGYVIITSRSELGWKDPIKLKKFKRNESISLLQKIIHIENEAQLDQLASLLFDHPLSLTQAGCYIRKHQIMDVNEYKTLFLNKREELWKREAELLQKDKDLKDIHDNYQMTAETALRLSLEELEKQSSLGVKLLFLCSFWHNNKIPEDILVNLSRSWGSDNMLDFNDALSEITKSSFFEKDRIRLKSGEEENTYSMHDLIPVVLQDLQSDKDKEKHIKDSLEIFTQFLKGRWDKSTQIFSKRPHLLPHLELLCNYAEQLKVYENNLIELKLHILEYQTYYTRDQETYERMVHDIGVLLKKVKNLDPLILARFNSDRVYSRSLFREEDERYTKKIENDFNKAIEVFQSSPLHIEELFRAYINFAQYYLFQGAFEKSLNLLDRAETLIKNIESESTKTLFHFVRAWVLTQKGDQALSQQAINRAVNQLEKEENLVFRIYVQQMKAWVDLKMGDYESAYHWAKIGLTQAKEFFGTKNNELIANLVLSMGLYKKNKGTYNEAEKYIKESLGRLENYYGGPYEVVDQADSNIILGDLYVEKGELLKAEKTYHLAEKILDTLFTRKEGDGYREVYAKLAILYSQLGDDFLAKHYFDLHKKYFSGDKIGSANILKAFKDNDLDI
ncbi:MAG: hypothetical protein BGO67_12375 [Alphaproteobacteria bacterium 41-28]|nr:MAG: hypothetical protein BGO67_12375 [Alphaproteobacteria bacterium 41-28]